MPPEKASRDVAFSKASDLATALADTTVDTAQTDGASGTGETTYTCEDWEKWYGYYIKVPELRVAFDAFGLWALGRGFIADALTKSKLDRLKGWGEDSFADILRNLTVCSLICGDGFAEIVRDENDQLLNVKVLSPDSMRTVVGANGILKRYEQISKTKKYAKRFKPNQILHIVNKRVADNIHGQSAIEPVEEIILANNELFFDVKKLFHRHVKPIMAFKVDSNSETKIAAFMAKMDAVVAKGENIYIPKDTVDFELVGVPPNATLNPIPWRNHLTNYFYRTIGVPAIVLGGGAESFTESSAKVSFLSFSQAVGAIQQQIILQVERQLYLTIELENPETIKNDMISDASKDGANQQMDIQAAETAVGAATGA